MTDQILIRQARPEDLPTLLAFEQALIEAERPCDPTMRPDEFHYYDLKAMILSDEAEVLVAEHDGKLVGSGHAKVRQPQPYNNFGPYAFLGFMYVMPEYRGKGINQRIIGELTTWAGKRGLQEIRLQVYDENIAAVKAYEKVGFRKILTEMRLSTS